MKDAIEDGRERVGRSRKVEQMSSLMTEWQNYDPGFHARAELNFSLGGGVLGQTPRNIIDRSRERSLQPWKKKKRGGVRERTRGNKKIKKNKKK